MSTYLTVFGCSFASVFLLGLQSKNVNQGRYIAAVMTSFFISISQFVFIRIAATGDLGLFVASATGGCIGIACSIWFYAHVMTKKPPKKGRWVECGPSAPPIWINEP